MKAQTCNAMLFLYCKQHDNILFVKQDANADSTTIMLLRKSTNILHTLINLLTCTFVHSVYRRLTKPHVYVVWGGGGGEEQQVGVPGEEAAVQSFGDRLQVQVLDPPHLQAGLLPCCRKLLMGHHDGYEEREKKKEESQCGG